MDGKIADTICFLLMHCILVTVYLILFREKHMQRFFSELLILLFLPIFGFILLSYSRWLRWKTYHFGVDNDKREQLNLLLEQEQNTETVSSPIKYSDDIVALNDVFYLDDVADKRKLLTTAMRQTALDDSSILKRAMRDADREVSHYAVSIATNNLSIMEKQVCQMDLIWKTKSENIEYLKDYAKFLQSYIVLDVLEKYSLEKLKNRYKEVLLKILSLEEDNGNFLEELVNLLLESENFAEAERIIKNFNLRNPEQEHGFLFLLKIYVMQKRHADAVRLLAELKTSKVRFSAEGIKLIRFWNLGVSNA